MLTKDNYYELEKICDIYAGMINDQIARYCDIAMKYDGRLAMRTRNPGERLPENPMDTGIKGLKEAQLKVKVIRDELERMRTK